jgi:hypothetical protein
MIDRQCELYCIRDPYLLSYCEIDAYVSVMYVILFILTSSAADRGRSGGEGQKKSVVHAYSTRRLLCFRTMEATAKGFGKSLAAVRRFQRVTTRSALANMLLQQTLLLFCRLLCIVIRSSLLRRDYGKPNTLSVRKHRAHVT